MASPPETPHRRLKDARELSALAHPVRMGIIEHLSVSGPLTATELADRLDESPANCSWHLRKLAEHGFVEEAGGGTGRQRPWRVPGIGFTWDDPDAGPEQRRAAEALSEVVDGNAPSTASPRHAVASPRSRGSGRTPDAAASTPPGSRPRSSRR